MEKQMVYAVVAFGGEYEDKWENLQTITTTLKEAEEYIKKYCSAFDETTWPMTVEQFEKSHYGYADDDYEETQRINRDGFTAEQFSEMEQCVSLRMLGFTGFMVFPTILNGTVGGGIFYSNKGERIE